MPRSIYLCSALAAAPFWATATPWALAQYTASILYPLTALQAEPSGPGAIYVNSVGQSVQGNLYWPGNSSSITLGASGDIYLNSANASQEVGQSNAHATLWTGSGASAVNLNPTGAEVSDALSTSGNQQVGYANPSFSSQNNTACLWKGSAATALNLNPSSDSASEALATDGTQQVGDGYAFALHACMWSGSASSYVDLNPSGWLESLADGVDGTQQVGYGAPPGTNPELSLDGADVHALLWNNSAGSFVDLNPIGYVLSQAFATNGTQQVGEVWITAASGFIPDSAPGDAMVWSGTARSAVDLEYVLPATDTWTESGATSVDASGDVFGYAEDASDNTYAVEWIPTVPEPASTLLVVLVAPFMLSRRKYGLAKH